MDTAVSGASATPGGATTQIQFNNAGSFGGDSNLVWDNTNKRLGIGVANPAVELVLRGSGGSVEAQIGPSSANDAGAILTLNSKLSGVDRTAFVQTNYNGALELRPHLGERLYVSDGTGGEIFTITPNGSVGVGVTSPSEKLAVESSNEDVELSLTNSSSTVARFPVASVVNYDGAGLGGYPSFVLANIRGSKASPSPTLDGDTLGSLNFGGAGTAAASGAEIKALAEGDFTASSSPGSLVFQTTPAGSLASVERMKITETGNVGIGTTSPEVELDVDNGVINASQICDENNSNCIDLSSGVAATSIRRQATEPLSGLVSGDVYFNTTDNTTYVFTGSAWTPVAQNGDSNSVVSAANPTTAFPGAVSGDVAFNSTSGHLEFYNGSSWVSTVTAGGDDLGDHTATQNLDLATNLLVGNGGSAGIAIDASGNVGIGTTSPVAKLHINDATTESGIRVQSAEGQLTFLNLSDSNSGWQIETNRPGITENFSISRNGVGTQVSIDQTGNVGIGTASPSHKLSVGDDMGTISGNNAITVGASGTNNTQIFLGNDGDNFGNLFWDGANDQLRLRTKSNAGALNTDQIVLDGATGNVGIGTTAPTADLSVNGSANKPGGGSWTVFSDIRLKDESSFKKFDYGLDEVMKLQPIHYNYALDNELELDSDEQHVGFVAQEVQKIVPEAVNQNESGYLEINNDPIIWTILNAVKELALNFKNTVAKIFDRISGVESQVAALKKENQDIKAENAEIKKELAEIKKMLIKSRAPAAVKD